MKKNHLLLRLTLLAGAASVVVGVPAAPVARAEPSSAAATTEKDIAKRAYQWLLNHQSSTGLVGNQESDDLAGVYTNSLAAICYIHEGNVDRAERIFNYYQKHLADAFKPGTPGGFHQFSNASTGEVLADTDRWIGDNAWLLMALNYHKLKTHKASYEPMRAEIAKWIISLQNPDGGIRAGFNKAGNMDHISVEGNLDSYAALIDFPEARRKVKAYLEKEMWVPTDKRFKMGSTVDESAMDTCSWAIASLGKQYASTFAYTEKKFGRTDTCESHGQSVSGFADVVDKKHIWFEGTGEMAQAYEVAGQKTQAAKYIAELEKAMTASQKYPDLLGVPCHSSDPSWKGGSTLIFVPSQCWYLLAKWNLNPFNPAEK